MSTRTACERSRQVTEGLDAKLKMVSPDTAFVDVGSGEHWVCIPESRCEQNVRQFGAFTCDLYAIREWLLEHHIKAVAMESTGVYWIGLFQVLDDAGLDVCLVNARDLKTVKGRPKTDKLDCQWGQRLHSYGLLRPSFRPAKAICAIRSIWRMREQVVRDAGRCIQRMQKAMHEMNLLLPKVVTDITGKTGMAIIKAILAGERNPAVLAKLRDPRVKRSESDIAKALDGNYRSEQLFLLDANLRQYEFLVAQLSAYDAEIERRLKEMPVLRPLSEPEHDVNNHAHKRDRDRNRNIPSFNARSLAHELTGVDLAAVPGFSSTLCLCTLFETGLDMSKWPTDKHFGSWLGLSPNPRISAGRDLCTHTKKCASRAARYFRCAATSLTHSHCYLGDFYRRMRARHGGAHAITATAHKLAVLYYNLLKNGEQFRHIDQAAYREAIRETQIRNLQKRAAKLGFALTPKAAGTHVA
ncbi:MAG: IS110 family transposase [Kiritimatiellae bacterium]|nr:IS110 family transposase [Kiritimatiellia bacterium]